ncbi:ABC transporter substrate-binding protein [Bradyrhizobium diazoefficiens]|uniref:ABC transporter substrate-binding protein n=1 Tax=Bradyrhizobium diazoefficiens (strain JCM 10833 / BCRC 13528 / IAM 13628 / NBRC 14792 / USDA 110) TaxID=224911 RepID=Q89KR2_BRADU|nr:ABC transporter substrate-binding protein [Bradyrhizobium diazoefficiens]AND90079.1 ABC transporter substrate-binding protein [Bradyrhizobium diazoefficiens USDA 110]PDT57124.1 carbohydrate ABC transporter substrate-binding protein [Bradyrhizobium diazoefficiens]QBP23624.1 carbohydrate ABC transporter substrate-binding protein [Bradyrhizobium diazoefficiens]QLD43355.1 carbohydrate ABC transporter substrate-binding protein [Bradyrhizobium diazoefficiens]WLB35020.1 ABC transporter substrate-b
MPITTTRRRLLAGSAAALALPAFARAQGAVKPRLTAISQWSAGSDGAAITALGKKFEEKGGVWQHSPVPGFTTEMMNKLRAQIIAGDPPACSQLKGPEIAAWSKIAPTVDLDAVVAAAGYEKVVAPDLAKLHKPGGKWIALPLQIYSTNMLFLSRRAMDKAKADKIPVTWADFNDLAEKMKSGGVAYPVANGGTRPDDGQKFEAALAGISPIAYRAAIMNLEKKTLEGPEIKAAFAQVRKIADWMDPNVGAQHFSTNLKRFIDGDMGMMIMGGWAQGVLRNAGFKLEDFIIAPGPSDNAKPVFLLNADAFIFWQRKEPDLQAGQTLMAQLVMDPAIQTMYSQITGSIPVRTDVDLSGEGWSDGQRRTAAALKDAIASNQAVLSLAHNMAQENGMTAAMIDVITEYVKNKTIKPEQAATRLAEAVEGAR